MSLRLRLGGGVDGSPMRIITQEFIGSSSSLGYSRAVGYSRNDFKKYLITIGCASFVVISLFFNAGVCQSECASIRYPSISGFPVFDHFCCKPG